MRTKLMIAAAIVAVATPAMAQGPHARSDAVQQRQQEARMYRYYGPDRFWPRDLAPGVGGGAIGMPGSVVGAPLGYDAYAYYRGSYPYSPYPYSYSGGPHP
jgi:hypothetical protein